MTDNKFFDGAFDRGTSFDYQVDEVVHTCEYHLPFYLALATLGQEVAVGSLCVSFEMTDAEKEASHFPLHIYGDRKMYGEVSLDLMIIPGTGVWLIETLWGDGKQERKWSEAGLSYLERALGRPHTQMPVRRAFFRVKDEPAAPKLRGLPPTMVYGPDDYPRVAHELISRLPADHAFDDVDDFIRELLGAGIWLDAKGPTSVYHCDWNIPTWLDDRLSLDAKMAS